MNAFAQAELLDIKRGLRAAQNQLDGLLLRTDQLEHQLTVADEPAAAPTDFKALAQAVHLAPPPEALVIPALSPIAPPPVLSSEAVAEVPDEVSTSVTEAIASQKPVEPPPLPPPFSTAWPTSYSTPDSPASVPPAFEPAAQPESAKWELRLGTYWFVRIGVVLLLTSLGFLAKLAYQRWHADIGPAGKIAFMYLGSLTLTGVGVWLQRRQESLKNYGQVLFGGGLAAIYFTTYAAHHFPALRIIESPTVSGLLLLAWAAVVTWLADWKKSELLATFAIGLGFYTAAITKVGTFTLYSNLVLASAAVVFLLRNRWLMLTHVSLAAAYVTHFIWRHVYQHGPGSGAELFWAENTFLFGYWTVFTVAGLMSRAEKFTDHLRATFVGINNAAFIALVTLNFWRHQTDDIWAFLLSAGVGLLGLSALAQKLHPNNPALSNTCLTKGIVLVTLGLVVKLSGPQLSLTLAAESVVLLVTGLMFNRRILRVGSYLAAGFSLMYLLTSNPDNPAKLALMALAISGAMFFNARWLLPHEELPDNQSARLRVSYFSTLGAVGLFLAVHWGIAPEWQTRAFALVSLGLIVAHYLWRMSEATLIGHGFMVVALVKWWLMIDQVPVSQIHASEPLGLVACLLALTHWWQRQTVLPAPAITRHSIAAGAALGIVLVLHSWLLPFGGAKWTPWLPLVLAATVTAYGLLTRAHWVTLGGQCFNLAAGLVAVFEIGNDNGQWSWPLLVIVWLTLCQMGAGLWLKRRPEHAETGYGKLVLVLIAIYQAIAAILTVGWIYRFIPDAHQALVLALVGVAIFSLGNAVQSKKSLAYIALFLVLGLFTILMLWNEVSVVNLSNFTALFLIAAMQQLARRGGERYQLPVGWHNFLISIVGVGCWVLTTRWSSQEGSPLPLTAAWALLAFAFFAVGLALRERAHRLVGLGLLGVALGRIVIVDFWQLDRLQQILSGMALGIVLLVLGYLYNRFEANIKRWL